jgi:hypothetical protein
MVKSINLQDKLHNMMKAQLNMSISGKDNRKLFAVLYRLFFPNKQPDIAKADNVDFSCTAGTLLESMPAFKNELFIRWNDVGTLSIIRNNIVLLGVASYNINPETVLSLLEKLPFEIASFETLYNEWYHPDHPYEAPSFGNGHVPHGWGCAFKGDGFKRLVSRRWLDFGPWKQYHGENDTQLIQFHELGVDNETALQQSRPGHLLMGISDEGGFIQDNYAYQYKNEGLYDAKEKKIKIIVHGTNISNRQLLDACAGKHYSISGSEMPADNVAYIFMEETKANEHLHAIWLHGLECRTIRQGKEITLTDTYNPSPQRPLWVAQ